MIKPWGKSIGLAVFFFKFWGLTLLLQCLKQSYIWKQNHPVQIIVCQKFSKFTSSMSVGQFFVIMLVWTMLCSSQTTWWLLIWIPVFIVHLKASLKLILFIITRSNNKLFKNNGQIWLIREVTSSLWIK